MTPLIYVIKARVSKHEQNLIDSMATHSGLSRSGMMRVAIRRMAVYMNHNGWDIDFTRPAKEEPENDGKRKR